MSLEQLELKKKKKNQQPKNNILHRAANINCFKNAFY